MWGCTSHTGLRMVCEPTVSIACHTVTYAVSCNVDVVDAALSRHTLDALMSVIPARGKGTAGGQRLGRARPARVRRLCLELLRGGGRMLTIPEGVAMSDWLSSLHTMPMTTGMLQTVFGAKASSAWPTTHH